MDISTLASTAAQISSAISLCAFLGALCFWLAQRSKVSSLYEIIRGQDVSHPEAVVKILTTFDNDEQRLKALVELLKGDQTKSKAVLAKVKDNINIPALTRQQQAWKFRVLVACALLFLVLAVIGFLASYFGPDGQINDNNAKKAESLPLDNIDLADVSFMDKPGEARAPQLDFKFTNMGIRSAFITRLNVNVKKVWRLRDLPQPTGMVVPPEHNYVVKLKPVAKPVSIPISHGLKRDEFGRFTVQVEEDPWTSSNTIFLANVEIIANSSKITIPTKDLLFLITQQGCLFPDAKDVAALVHREKLSGRDVNLDRLEEDLKANRKMILEASEYAETRNSALDEMITTAKKSDFEEGIKKLRK